MLTLNINYYEKLHKYTIKLSGEGTLVVKDFHSLMELGEYVKRKEPNKIFTENEAVIQYLKLMGYHNIVAMEELEEVVGYESSIIINRDSIEDMLRVLINNDYLFSFTELTNNQVLIEFSKLK